MDANESLFSQGLTHYSEALFAITRFEEIVASEIDGAMTTEVKAALAGLFSVKALSGGGFTAFRPTVEQICKLSPEEYWAFPARQYWIEVGTLYVGLLIENEKQFAAVGFGGLHKFRRDLILNALQVGRIDSGFVKDAGEIHAKQQVSRDISANVFRQELSKLLEAIIIALRNVGPLVAG